MNKAIFLAILYSNCAYSSEFRISDFMRLVKSSSSYKNYVERLTINYSPDFYGTFFANNDKASATPERPQVFLGVGNATIAYAPETYSEVFWSNGQETITFAIAERPDHKLTINAKSFNSRASVQPPPEFELTPDQVLNLHQSELIEKTNRFAERACKGCHLHARRRLFEPDNHERRFQFDPTWAFRERRFEDDIRAKLTAIFHRFADNLQTRNDPIYRWFWSLPRVIARGGQLLPDDTFTYDTAVKAMITANAAEMLGELKGNPNWPNSKDVFAAAVNDDGSFNTLCSRYGYSDQTLFQEQQRVAQLHATLNLQHIRQRNNETIAWILAGGDHQMVGSFAGNEYLLLNTHAIQTIGPKILNMTASDREWASLDAKGKSSKIRLRDTAAGSIDALKEIVESPTVKSLVRRRTNTHIVLAKILGNDNKALTYLSTSGKLSAETGGAGADLLDCYANALGVYTCNKLDERRRRH